MKRVDIINLAFYDALHGDMTTLSGLLDYLLYDCGVSLERLVKLAIRKYRFSESHINELLSYLLVYPVRFEDTTIHRVH